LEPSCFVCAETSKPGAPLRALSFELGQTSAGRQAFDIMSLCFGLVVLVSGASAFNAPISARRPTLHSSVPPLLALVADEPPSETPEAQRRSPVPALATVALAAAAVFLHPSSAHAVSSVSLGESFAQATSLIFVSELGDKTFFIAALLAARASKLLTFAGCAGALAFMTVISVAIGQVFHAVPPSLTRGLPLDDYVAIASFLFFGVKSLVDALGVQEDGAGIAEEREDAEKLLDESGTFKKGGWPLVLEASTLTLAAEIGDRSQIATIALGAAANPFGVALGGTFGHCLATGLAVIGGSFISKYFSERVIGIVGGVLFIFFALTTFIGLF